MYYKSLRLPIEDDLKILKVEYLSNQLLDHTQIFNLSLDDQTIFLQIFKIKTTPMEYNLKIKSGISQQPLNANY